MNPPVTAQPTARRRFWRWPRRVLLGVLLASAAMSVYLVYRPLPAGIAQAMPLRAAGEISLLTDVTYVDSAGTRHSDQQVFDEALRLIGQAQKLIVLDMFLFNDFGTTAAAPALRPLSDQLTRALLQRKQQVPDLDVVVITDPINTLYGGTRSKNLDALRAAGMQVVVTDLTQLRAPNATWSGFWQLCCRWTGNSPQGGWLPNPFGPGKVTLRTYLALLNLNANHRKTLVVDSGDDWTGLIATANPHDGSSAHGNAALRFNGAAALDLLHSERAVAAMSGAAWPQVATDAVHTAAGTVAVNAAQGGAVQVVTEGRIRDALLTTIDAAKAGDPLDIAVFYFSHRGLVQRLIAAHQRGVKVRVLLDPNEDAFGRKKNGIPNRQVALELHEAGIPVRWCDTHGEQCHSKLMLRQSADGGAELIVGSANYTRRNLDDYNLESSARVVANIQTPVIREARDFFEQSWNNTQGRRISVAYSQYEDRSRWRYWRYRFTEATGLSSF